MWSVESYESADLLKTCSYVLPALCSAQLLEINKINQNFRQANEVLDQKSSFAYHTFQLGTNLVCRLFYPSHQIFQFLLHLFKISKKRKSVSQSYTILPYNIFPGIKIKISS